MRYRRLLQCLVVWSFVIWTLVTGIDSARGAEVSECDGLGSENMPALRVGQIVGTDRAYFLTWMLSPECRANSQKCRQDRQPYVIPGDRVVVTGVVPGFVCAAYSKNGRSDVDGWLPEKQVKIEDPAKSPQQLTRWVGEWSGQYASAWIDIGRGKGHTLHAVGHAELREGEYEGDFEGDLSVIGNTAKVNDEVVGNYGCVVSLLLLGGLMAVTDNEACGGLNVRFIGWFIRQRK